MLEVIIPVVLVAVIVGLAVFFLVKLKQKKKNFNKQFSYTTKHGIRVKLSEMLKDLPQSDIEAWTEDVVEFWFQTKGWDRNQSYKAISFITLFLYDLEYLNRASGKSNGLTWPDSSMIELATLHKAFLDQSIYTPYSKVKSLS
jgi:hypothetical protein